MLESFHSRKMENVPSTEEKPSSTAEKTSETKPEQVNIKVQPNDQKKTEQPKRKQPKKPTKLERADSFLKMLQIILLDLMLLSLFLIGIFCLFAFLWLTPSMMNNLLKDSAGTSKYVINYKASVNISKSHGEIFGVDVQNATLGNCSSLRAAIENQNRIYVLKGVYCEIFTVLVLSSIVHGYLSKMRSNLNNNIGAHGKILQVAIQVGTAHYNYGSMDFFPLVLVVSTITIFYYGSLLGLDTSKKYTGNNLFYFWAIPLLILHLIQIFEYRRFKQHVTVLSRTVGIIAKRTLSKKRNN